jgi:hypothetical protein
VHIVVILFEPFLEVGMSRSEELIQAYATNTWLIGRLTEGITHDESLLQPPFPTNSTNWVLGHILVSRNESMVLSMGENMWPDAILKRYDSGSEPITREDESVRYLNDMLKDITESQERLGYLLGSLTDHDLERDCEDEKGARALWLCIRGLHWHETYHIGQLEMLRSFIHSLRVRRRT